jgi:hypothetical protein
MPFEKFFLCSRNVFILGSSHTSPTINSKNDPNQGHCIGEIVLDSQDHCHGRSPGHLGGCGIRQNAYLKPELSLFSQKQRNRKQREGYVPPSRFVFRLLKSSIACVCNRYGLLSIHHASGGTFEERTDEHLSQVSDTRHKVNILGYH